MNLKNKTRLANLIDEVHQHNILIESREIFLHSNMDNDEDGGIDFKVANNFIKNMRLLESLSAELPIVIHQHSIGGQIDDAIAIYDMIESCSCHVIIITHGIAASVGSMIPQAADLIITMPSCSWMIHEGEIEASNVTRKQGYSYIDYVKGRQKHMMSIFVERCAKKSNLFKDKTHLQIHNAIKKELDKKEDWWLSAEDAVQFGFCDGVYGSKEYPDIETIKNVC